MEKFDKNFIQYNDEKVKSEKHNLTWYLTTRIIFYILLIFFAIFFIWYTAFITTHSFYTVSGPSMMPTLNARITDADFDNPKLDYVQSITYDAVYINKASKAKVFDIVVVNRKSDNKDVIKRLMATEGDYISIAKDETGFFKFYRIAKDTNMENFSDEQAKLDEMSGENGYKIRSYQEWTNLRDSKIENGIEYEENFFKNYIKNNYASDDRKDDIFISDSGLIYVKVPKNKCFYMGDNRGHSGDSRAQEAGFEDYSRIVGRGEFIVYDYNFGNRLWEVVKFYFREMEKFFAR